MAETIETTETTEAPTLPISPIVDNLTDRPSYSPPSGQLTSTDILGKMEAGQPLYQGETLPDVPKGVSAKGFYGQFPGGASVYSQAPFRRGTYMPMSAPSTSIFDPTGGGDGTTTTPQEEAPVDTQMDSLVPVDTDIQDSTMDDDEPSFTMPSVGVDSDNPSDNIDLPDNLRELFEDVTNYPYVEKFNNVIKTGVKNLSDGVEKGIETFHKELSDLGDELGRLAKDPLGEVYLHIKGEVDGVLEFLSDPFSAKGLDKAASAITKTVAQQMLGGMLAKLGLGMAAGPAAFMIVNLISGEGTQEGMPGMSYPKGVDEWEGDYNNKGEPTTVWGYNSLGVAVDEKGREVFHYNPVSHTYTDRTFKNVSSAVKFTSRTPKEKELAHLTVTPIGRDWTQGDIGSTDKDMETLLEEAEERGDLKGDKITPVVPYDIDLDAIDSRWQEKIKSSLSEVEEDYEVDNAVVEKTKDILKADINNADKLLKMVDKALNLPPEKEASINAATAAAISAVVNAAEAQAEDVGYQESGEDPSGDKIICTMMNRMYGLGEYRIKQWLLYSKRHLKDEHQLGYHKLYCNLVAKMPTNRILAKILSHLADKRTDDIVAEMKGTKRSWLGRLYRTTLIDGPSYIVGMMIKKNWLKPADISVLQKT